MRCRGETTSRSARGTTSVFVLGAAASISCTPLILSSAPCMGRPTLAMRQRRKRSLLYTEHLFAQAPDHAMLTCADAVLWQAMMTRPSCVAPGDPWQVPLTVLAGWCIIRSGSASNHGLADHESRRTGRSAKACRARSDARERGEGCEPFYALFHQNLSFSSQTDYHTIR